MVASGGRRASVDAVWGRNRMGVQFDGMGRPLCCVAAPFAHIPARCRLPSGQPPCQPPRRTQTGVLYRNVIRFSSPRVAFSGARGYVLMIPGMRFAPDIRAEPYARTVPDPFDEQ